jgi:hypothetical protein
MKPNRTKRSTKLVVLFVFQWLLAFWLGYRIGLGGGVSVGVGNGVQGDGWGHGAQGVQRHEIHTR